MKNSLLLVALLSVVGCSKSMSEGALGNELTQVAPPPPNGKGAPAPLPTVQRSGQNDDGLRPVGPKGAAPSPTVARIANDDSVRPSAPASPAPLPTVARPSARTGIADDGVRPRSPAPAPAPTAR